ncbi:hypothetical protein SDJN03_17669, partial [Cucurbita argyrosperma subsp. sororia]
MGRHSSETTMIGTSIALLQERFRQLQKDKQRREKKELLSLLSDSNRVNTSSIMHLESNRSSNSRDLNPDSLSLGLNSSSAGKQVDIHEARALKSANYPTDYETQFDPFLISGLSHCFDQLRISNPWYNCKINGCIVWF